MFPPEPEVLVSTRDNGLKLRGLNEVTCECACSCSVVLALGSRVHLDLDLLCKVPSRRLGLKGGRACLVADKGDGLRAAEMRPKLVQGWGGGNPCRSQERFDLSQL